jgi:SAM-dependent methyltransferase
MTTHNADMQTDAAWELWGKEEPYFGVLTDPKFKRSALTDETMQEFYDSGKKHVEYTFDVIKTHISPSFAPKTVLDFGCGVGRLLIPFSESCEAAYGIDISDSMLKESARQLAARNRENVTLIVSDDKLTKLTNFIEFIHSFIVFQHIPPARGYVLLSALLDHLAPGGVVALHFTYSKSSSDSSHGYTEFSELSEPTEKQSLVVPTLTMQMNSYNLSKLMYIFQKHRFYKTHIEFTDHGGELGAFIFATR